MTAKRATVRLYVAMTGLFASLFELVEAFVRLVTACLEHATRRVAPAAPAAAPATSKAGATIAMTEDERLVSALMSLGFRAPNIRAFAATVRGRQAPLEVLVKEGIVALSATLYQTNKSVVTSS